MKNKMEQEILERGGLDGPECAGLPGPSGYSGWVPSNCYYFIEDVLRWIRIDINRFFFERGEIKESSFFSKIEENEVKIYLCTLRSRYRIFIKNSDPDKEYFGYLGCQVSNTSSYYGEDWIRGNDLSDGTICPETWRQILGDIVSTELLDSEYLTQSEAIISFYEFLKKENKIIPSFEESLEKFCKENKILKPRTFENNYVEQPYKE